jgi:hypothetical protein
MAQEGAFVPSSWGHHCRSTGIEIHVPDYDDVDCERGSVVDSLVDAALVPLVAQVGENVHGDNLGSLT